MQFIPSTWSVVGVDADGDGKRNPQDIDDAALATAVYLCSGTDDLGTGAGQRAAVYRYNHSQSYVDLVLSIMDAYLDGDFTSVPNGTTSAATSCSGPARPSRAAGGAPAPGWARAPGGRDDPGPRHLAARGGPRRTSPRRHPPSPPPPRRHPTAAPVAADDG